MQNNATRENVLDVKNQSSDKLLKIIECLAANRLSVRLTDLAERLKMPQPTVFRYLRTLCDQGYAYHDDVTGCYALTWKICRLSDAVKTNLVLRNMAGPFVNELANELNVGALLATERGGEILFLDLAENPRRTVDTLLRIGKDAPIHATGSGKIMLSSMSEREVDTIIAEKGLVRLTPKTITDKKVLMCELERIRKNGYAIDEEECEEGQRCVSVPLYDYSGGTAAAISVFDNVDLLTDERLKDVVLPRLLSAASQISFRLGCMHYKEPQITL